MKPRAYQAVLELEGSAWGDLRVTVTMRRPLAQGEARSLLGKLRAAVLAVDPTRSAEVALGELTRTATRTPVVRQARAAVLRSAR